MPEMPRYTWGAKGFGRNPLRAAGTEEFEPMRVLIVEDEPLVALELEELLLDEGFEVVGSATDAAQAIDLGRRHRPDVAFLDLNLADGLTGPRIAKTLVHERLATVVFVTGRRTYYPPTCTERSASSRSPVLVGL
jgi:DNA-binding LytR/AlgR family response regulator